MYWTNSQGSFPLTWDDGKSYVVFQDRRFYICEFNWDPLLNKPTFMCRTDGVFEENLFWMQLQDPPEDKI